MRSGERVNSLTPQEKTLYRAWLLFEGGDFSGSYSLAASLLSSDEINIRLGALYLQAFNSLYHQDYDSADLYSVLFNGLKLFVELAKISSCSSVSEMTDLSVYEMVCLMSDSSGYCFAAMYMNIVLSMFYGAFGKKEDECLHLRRAIEICAEHGFYSTFSSCAYPNTDVLESPLSSFSHEAGEHISNSINIYISS